MCIVEVLAVSVSLVAVRKRQLDRALVAALSFSQCIANTILQFMPRFLLLLLFVHYSLHVTRYSFLLIHYSFCGSSLYLIWYFCIIFLMCFVVVLFLI